jgi:hypothetical protein
MALSDQDFTSYAGDEVVVSVMGKKIQGTADGLFVRIRHKSPLYSDRNGTDALVSRSRLNDWRAEIEIYLEQGSASNAILSALAEAGRRSKNGADVGVVRIQDTNGFSLHLASKAWISKLPDTEYARETGTRMWTISCARLQTFDGGA